MQPGQSSTVGTRASRLVVADVAIGTEPENDEVGAAEIRKVGSVARDLRRGVGRGAVQQMIELRWAAQRVENLSAQERLEAACVAR